METVHGRICVNRRAWPKWGVRLAGQEDRPYLQIEWCQGAVLAEKRDVLVTAQWARNGRGPAWRPGSIGAGD